MVCENFRSSKLPLSSGLLMTDRALFRGWRRWIQIRSSLDCLIMAIPAVVMESLLISHNRRLGAGFELYLRNLRKQFGLGVCARVAIATDGADGIRIFFCQLHCQRRRPGSRPDSFVRRMLDGFRRGLGSVMTLDARNLFGAVRAAVFSDVFEMIKSRSEEHTS